MSMCVQVASYVAFSSQKAYRLAVSTESSAGIHSATFGDLEVDERALFPQSPHIRTSCGSE